MHPLFLKTSGLTHDVIGSAIEVQAIEVHKDQGPGLLESIDEWCLTMELGGTRYVQVCAGMRRYAQVCAGMRRYAQVCAGMRRTVRTM